MPEDTIRDASIQRGRELRVAPTIENLDVLAGVRKILPNLKPDPNYSGSDSYKHITHLSLGACEFLTRANSIILWKLEDITDDLAQLLSGFSGHLHIGGLRKLGVAAAESLALAQGSLSLGLRDLSMEVAECLSKHRGEIEFSLERPLTPQVAQALSRHSGQLTINGLDELTLDVAKHLSRHKGPLSLDAEQIDEEAASALLHLEFPLELVGLKRFPEGSCGVALCKKFVDDAQGSLWQHLESLPPQCAEVLALSTINLTLYLDTWTDDVLIRLGHHRGELKINPKNLSDEVGAAWTGCNLNKSIEFENLETLSDAAAKALGIFAGEITINASWGGVTMTPKAAGYLVNRSALTIPRSRLSKTARKVFDAHGKWVEYTWTRTS